MRAHHGAWILTLMMGVWSCSPRGRDQEDEGLPVIPAGGETTVRSRTSNAYTMPAANLDEAELNLHAAGDSMFEAAFVAGPSKINPGLGPAFNNNSCESCHLGNGRGMATLGQAGSLNSPMLVRISLDPSQAADFLGADTKPLGHGPIPVPGLGGQLQDQAVSGATAEVTITLNWSPVAGQYDDGTPYTLRLPVLTFSGREDNAALMQNPAVLRSLRQTPPVFGVGLLEAVALETLEALEDPSDRNQDGIRGRLNRVWDPLKQEVTAGRLGWKASAPSVLVQTAGAFAEDMGVHNPIFPDADGTVEVTLDQVKGAAYYMQTLAVPDRDRTLAGSRAGEKLFRDIGCASCHRPSLTTGSDHPIAALRDQTFAPYTDLLLHDMGEGLADERPDYQASGREWRTAPLWGIGLAQTVLPGSGYLHDGRARTLEEAILWHGGEAEASQKRFKALPAASRSALIMFLKSL
ncbi:MAG TPA: di-heme oxidoredictase family protein [Oligoflexus sp.]|uniref:di-heme oxidoreductase family protein n=1 Tax=Oligoflexus sp. TaxID=1971216 RepID=UPI002D801263|nr:di-heme oxidoredictase family protein [Oligoflexus sp.]HET9237288.1 di-heme oxidoredictase family protein [Oligoflexus sp.]